MDLMLLNTALQAVCPIDGVSIGSWSNRATWRIDFQPTATSIQRVAALAVLAAYDPLAPAPLSAAQLAANKVLANPAIPQDLKDFVTAIKDRV